jgi:chromosomal replication initiation ATPase DnaA
MLSCVLSRAGASGDVNNLVISIPIVLAPTLQLAARNADEKGSKSSRPAPGIGHHVSASPGGGKSHLAAALGFALVENGWRVLFTRTTDLVQRLQIARRELALEAAIAKPDKYHLLILDDLAYVTKDQAETSVLFELISARYERRSLLITANQPFGNGARSSRTRQ